MSIKRIFRVYYDLPDYIVPKEVAKIFRLMTKRRELMIKINNTMRDVKKAPLEVELSEVDSDIEMVAEVITPKHCNWMVKEHETSDAAFWVLTLTEPVEESLLKGGQDD